MDCVADCDACLKIKPDFVKAMRRKGLAQVQMLKFDDAIYTYKSAFELDKSNEVRREIEDAEHFKSNFEKYKISAEREDFEEALSCINFLVNNITTSDVLKMWKVEALAKTGATTDALTLLKSIQSATNNSPDTWYLKGIIELYSGESGRAKKFFAEGMRLDPDNTKCRISLNKAKKCEQLKEEGNEFIKAGKFEEAEAKYTEAIELDPFNKKLNSVIFSNRALTFMKRK